MKKLVFVVLSLFLTNLLYADQWRVSGPRAMGMGGAFVAIAEGPLAQQWNPAGLAKRSRTSFFMGMGANMETSGDHTTKINKVNDN